MALVVLASALLAQLVWQFGTIPDYPVLQNLLRVSRMGVVAGLAAVAIFVIGNSIGSLVRASPRFSSALRTLSDASFGVFLVHLFVFAVLQDLFPSVKEGLSMKAITGAYVVVVVVSFALSIVARRLPLVRSVF